MARADAGAIRAAVDAAGRHLPPQAPLSRFIHFISLQGDADLPFDEAVRRARVRRGVHGWPAAHTVRQAVSTGRLTPEDVATALREVVGPAVDDALATAGGRVVRRAEVLTVALEHPLPGISVPTLRDRLLEGATVHVAREVSPEAARRLLRGRPAAAVLGELWRALLVAFDASAGDPRDPPEDLEARARAPAATRSARSQAARALADDLRAHAGRDLTLAAAWSPFVGADLEREVSPVLATWLARFADEGVATWRSPDRTAGFWPWLKARLAGSPAWAWGPTAREAVLGLSDEPCAACADALLALDVPGAWAGALVEREVMSLQGWSAMAAWYGARADDPAQTDRPLGLADVVAARLALTLAAVGHAARRIGLDARLSRLLDALEQTPDAMLARHAASAADLDDDLARKVRRLDDERAPADHPAWVALAHTAATRAGRRHAEARARAARTAWPTFLLTQHLALDAEDVRALGRDGVARLHGALVAFDADTAGAAALEALERTWRDTVGNALAAVRGQGAPATVTAQIVTCIDDREESLRRHVEEIDPSVETCSAAGFFSVPMLYRGLDDRAPSARCPVVVEPRHLVEEEARPGAVRPPQRLGDRLGRILGIAPPHRVPTRLAFTAHAPDPARRASSPQRGFTDEEQVDIVAGALVAWGISATAPLVVVLGHGAASVNNPYELSYGCGACAGNPGGANARLLAAMANRPAVRRELVARGLAVPDTTHFLGAEHDTAADTITWFDLDDLPAEHEVCFARLRAALDQACARSAHERVRRLPLAPADADEAAALRHVRARVRDPRQARPELGHTGNALAVVGRRALTRGLFLDRRVFLVSYDARLDPDGDVLEATLMAAGPVGAQINMDYYFSATDRDGLGAGTKAGQNLVAGLGVLQGAEGDLRTGLPWQMIEQHEPLRLLMFVEARREHLAQVRERRAVIRDLIDGAWVHLVAIDPDDGSFHRYVPGTGFVPWTPPERPVPVRASSRSWYEGQSGYLGPARIAADGGDHDA